MTPSALSPARKHRRQPRDGAERLSGSCRPGFLLLEASAALALTGLLIGVVVAVTVAFDRAGDYYTAHHRAQLAAESYLESLRAGVPPADTDEVRYQITRRPGQGPWRGQIRLTITATVTARHGREVSFAVNTYLPSTELPAVKGSPEATP